MSVWVSVWSECTGTFLVVGDVYQSPVFPYQWLYTMTQTSSFEYTGELNSEAVRITAELIYSGSMVGEAGALGTAFDLESNGHTTLIKRATPCPPGTAFTTEEFIAGFHSLNLSGLVDNQEEATVEVKIINVELLIPDSLPSSRLYKLEAFDETLIEVSNPPPQVNRPSPLPPGFGDDPYDGGWRPPTSFGSSSAPSGGSSNNPNTNNRNLEDTDRDPINNPRDREELLRLMHKHNVSGMQY